MSLDCKSVKVNLSFKTIGFVFFCSHIIFIFEEYYYFSNHYTLLVFLIINLYWVMDFKYILLKHLFFNCFPSFKTIIYFTSLSFLLYIKNINVCCFLYISIRLQYDKKLNLFLSTTFVYYSSITKKFISNNSWTFIKVVSFDYLFIVFLII